MGDLFLGPYADPNEALGLSGSISGAQGIGLAPPPAAAPAPTPTVAAPPSPSISGAEPPRPPSQLDTLNGFQKWLLMMNDRDALTHGRTPPSDVFRAREQKQRMDQLAAAQKLFADRADTAMLLPPEKRDAYINANADEFEQVLGPGNGDVFRALTGRRAALATNIDDALKIPEVAAMYSAEGMPGLIKAFQNKDIIEKIGRRGDLTQRATVVSKLGKIEDWLKRTDPKEYARLNKDGLQAHEIEALNDRVPSTYQLTPQELDTANNDADTWRGAGIEPPSAVKLKEEERIKADEEIRKQKAIKAIPSAEDDALKQNQRLTGENNLRGQFNTESKSYQTARQGKLMLDSLKNNPQTGQRDLAMIINSIKVRDPLSVVREGEIGLQQRAQGLLDRLLNTGSRVVNGETVLPESAVKNMLETSDSEFDALSEAQQDLQDQFQGIAKRSNFEPSNVIEDFVGEGGRGRIAKRKADREAARKLPEGVPPGSQQAITYPDGRIGYITPEGKKIIWSPK